MTTQADMSTATSITPTEITALLFCPTSKGAPSAGKEYALSLTKDGAGYSVTARFGKAGLNPLPQHDDVVKSVAYNDALKAFFTRLNEKLTQKPDTYTVKKGSIPPEIEEEGYRLAGLKRMAAKSVGSDWLTDRLNKLLHPDKVEKIPVLLDGPQGTGKTYAVREFGLSAGFSTIQEVAGHSGVEALDLLGGFAPVGDGSFAWVDGPVTAAYRAAAEGRKALLLLDEVYRIPLKQRNFLLNALVPHRMPDGKQYYMLRANRIKPGSIGPDGVAKTEMIPAPVENLSIVGTSNSGSAFVDVEVDDPAAKERWHIIHVKMDEAAQRRIMVQTCVERKLPVKFADAILQLCNNTKKLTHDQFLEHALSPRLGFRVLSFISTPDKQGFEAAAKEMIPTVAGRAPDGELIKEHTEAYEKALSETISKVGL